MTVAVPRAVSKRKKQLNISFRGDVNLSASNI
jgi:hypothetical protein